MSDKKGENLSIEEMSIINIIKKTKYDYYKVGLNHEPFGPMPKLTLETSDKERCKMIDDYNLEYCKLKDIDTFQPEFSNLFCVLHLMVEIYASAYLAGLEAFEKTV